MQTYGELMFRETVSFRERYGFVLDDYPGWQAARCEELGLVRVIE